MNTDGGFLLSSLLGIWLIGPIGICFVSLSILIMCLWRVEANVIKPETLIVDTKNFFYHHQNTFSSQVSLLKITLIFFNEELSFLLFSLAYKDLASILHVTKVVTVQGCGSNQLCC